MDLTFTTFDQIANGCFKLTRHLFPHRSEVQQIEVFTALFAATCEMVREVRAR